MDKNAIKKYAVWARRELISRVSQKAQQFGIEDGKIVNASADTINGHVLSATEKSQRQALIAQIHSKGYQQVMEEVAYTWFNRFSALRFMEVNGYLPSRIRVFTDENNQFEPQIIAEAIDLDFDGLDMEKVYAYKDANDEEGLFKYLIITQCNALNPILPGMFQRIADYTELLFPDNLLREGSVLQRMIEWIPEENWQDAVQIIGWLYQFYNIEPKAEVFAKKTGKVTKEEIPAATQLFTPDWIVRYMVENSLGRLWVERNAGTAKDDYDEYPGDINEILLSKWKYYVFEAEQEPEVQTELTKLRKSMASMVPEDIKCIDPCCGSGHILAYIFDVLMQIYETYGYTAREAVHSIIENNIYGLDIDERAAQLAYFSIMMKARQYDRRFLTRRDENGLPNIPQPHVFAIVESNCIDKYALDYFVNGDLKLEDTINTIVREMRDAKEYGSILNITPVDFNFLYSRFSEVQDDISISRDTVLNDLLPLVEVAEVLARKYDIVITNPPYMSVGVGSTKLKNYVKKYYPDSKADMFAVFIEKCHSLTKKNGLQAMITMHAWMFLSSYEKLRNRMQAIDMINMAHLGARAFEEIGGEVVQTTSFVMRNSRIMNYLGKYCRLVEPNSQDGKRDLYLLHTNEYVTKLEKFALMPGMPYAYWISDSAVAKFKETPIGDIALLCQGLTTTDNNKYVRFWYEPDFENIGLSCTSREQAQESGLKWFPFNKGGSYCKWYGNNELVVNYENDGMAIKQDVLSKYTYLKTPDFVVKNSKTYFSEGLTWSALSNDFSMRWFPAGAICADKGQGLFAPHSVALYCCGLLNSAVSALYLKIISPTLDFNCGYVRKVPYVYDANRAKKIVCLVQENIQLAKTNWDEFETSWDFLVHPLSLAAPTPDWNGGHLAPLDDCYAKWTALCEKRFNQMKANEEELNRLFIDIYNLHDELSPEVEDKDVTVRLADKKRDIKSLLSYAVGCMFGRYSLDEPGLIYAGGDWGDVFKRDALTDAHSNALTFGGVRIAVNSTWQINTPNGWVECTFCPEGDNIIPICDDDYFEDDITGKFIQFIETVFGKESLEENLCFIADALGGKGQPRDVIRNYFLNDFYTDHLKTYQKRPIYWLFDSGKKNGFKALIYMHRYQPDTIARMRTDYVHEQQARYRTAITDLEQRIAVASTSERVKLNRQLKKIQEQSTEIQGYEEKIHHLADQYIAIDLDDGVKVNYAKFQDVLAKIK